MGWMNERRIHGHHGHIAFRRSLHRTCHQGDIESAGVDSP
jgi:hypothetical protein